MKLQRINGFNVAIDQSSDRFAHATKASVFVLFCSVSRTFSFTKIEEITYLFIKMRKSMSRSRNASTLNDCSIASTIYIRFWDGAPIHNTHDNSLPDYVFNFVDPSLRCLFPLKLHIFSPSSKFNISSSENKHFLMKVVAGNCVERHDKKCVFLAK